MSKYNWTRQETKDLITLYEINECLWNKHLREYKDRDERISSIQSISDEMKISIEEINKKIHNLRNQYRFELNKSKKTVPGKPKYTTKWPYFANLSFLENIVSVRGSNLSQNNGTGEFNDTNEYTVVSEVFRITALKHNLSGRLSRMSNSIMSWASIGIRSESKHEHILSSFFVLPLVVFFPC